MDISELVGKIILAITSGKGVNAPALADDVIVFTTDNGTYQMFHEQNCCEHVYIDDIAGNIEDLLHTPILEAYEESNREHPSEEEAITWTFYRLTTIKGTVTIKWYGSSNGYYSEAVTFMQV